MIEKHDDLWIVECQTGLESLELPDPDDPQRYAGFAADVVWAKAHGERTPAGSRTT